MFNFSISACLLEGYDKGGYDLGMLSGVKSAADCRVLCQKRKECLSFVATEYQQCFLKYADLEKTGGSINNNIGVTLGSKYCGESWLRQVNECITRMVKVIPFIHLARFYFDGFTKVEAYDL